MKYIECPDTLNKSKESHPVLFLAGGITGCPLWQDKIIIHLEKEPLVILNPRRKNFDANNPLMEKEQIEWEYNHLNLSDIISFWFPCETLCPISLFELGDRMALGKAKILIGCHPEYKRIRDIKIQTKLRNPNIEVVESLEELVDQIKESIRK